MISETNGFWKENVVWMTSSGVVRNPYLRWKKPKWIIYNKQSSEECMETRSRERKDRCSGKPLNGQFLYQNLEVTEEESGRWLEYEELKKETEGFIDIAQD